MRLAFILAIRGLTQGGRRVLLLALSLGLAACLLVLVASFFEGMRLRIIRSGTALHAGHVNVGGISRSGTGRVTSVVPDAGALVAKIERQVPGVEQALARLGGFADLASEAGVVGVVALGIDASRERRLFSLLRAGGVQLEQDTLQASDALLIFREQAERLELGLGDRVTLVGSTLRGTLNTVGVRVAAIADDLPGLSDGTVFAHEAALRELFRLPPDSAQKILCYFDRPQSAETGLERIQDLLAAEGRELVPYVGNSLYAERRRAEREQWQGDRLVLSTWRAELGFLLWRLAAASGISVVLFTVLALVTGIGVINAMQVALELRTREIGTVRALGLSRRQVMLQFILEAWLLGVAAAGGGAIVALGVGTLVNILGVAVDWEAFRYIFVSDLLLFSIRPEPVLQVVLGVSVVSALATVWPAFRAARLRPVVALHHEE